MGGQFMPGNPSGLSPRVRGNHSGGGLAVDVAGSIPACTGEPSVASCRACSSEVYPRVYGGTTARLHCGRETRGLSPRVRGNPVGRHIQCRLKRSIPACTGEPKRMSICVARIKVYPRVYGGTIRAHAEVVVTTGLSPRVRGNHPDGRALEVDTGSIPACTGEPSAGASLARISTVYPRVYGGTPQQPFQVQAPNGLSPRVRGNLRLV